MSSLDDNNKAPPRIKNRLSGKNSAFVFIKPPANKEIVFNLVKSKLQESCLKIVFECRMSGEQIVRQKLIDRHYDSLSSKALVQSPKSLNVSSKFEDFFGESWDKVLRLDKVENAKQAMSRMNCNESELISNWEESEKEKKVINLGKGLHIGLLKFSDNSSLYVINGFYIKMRQTYEKASIHAYVIEWNSDKLSFSDFTNNVIGATDPSKANEGSLRRIILENYEEYDVCEPPNTTNNVLHASGSPFEGVFDRCNFLGRKIIDDEYGKALIAVGLTEATLKKWFKNPMLPIPPYGKMESLFDYIEGTNTAECLEKLVSLYDYDLTLVEQGGCTCTML